MTRWRTWLPLCLTLISAAAGAAGAATELGTVTQAEGGGGLLLRGATWYKLATGWRVEEGDILTGVEHGLVQIEFAGGGRANLAGAFTLYLAPPPKGGPPLVLALPTGWLKVVVTPPGLRLHLEPFDAAVTEGILVVHAQGPAADLFVEAGAARLIELTPTGADGTGRDAKRGEYWAKPGSGAFSSTPRAPKSLVDAMPRQYLDPLPQLAGKVKSKPVPVVDHEITYAEAEPWLAGRERAVFEKRFTSRLRDPAFRKAVEPSIAKYPMWDRILHPEKYLPKEPKTP